MKQLLRSLHIRLTYRDHTNPADGLDVSNRWGKRTVHHPDIPAYLNGRRRRIVREGLDDIDIELMDPDTCGLLPATATCMYCICDPTICDADDSGQHCQDQSCGSCLHGCPTDECNPAAARPSS